MRDFRQDTDSRKIRGRYAKFCQEQLSKYSRVLYVMGNHESYRELFEETPGLLRDFLKKHAPNTRLLDNETEVFLLGEERLAVAGTTLWARCGADTAEEWRIANAMQDFSLIRTERPSPRWYHQGRRAFQPYDALHEHEKALAWLRQELPKHERVIVLSHHAPSYESSAGHLHNTDYLDDAYCSNQVDLILDHPQIEVYCHGHTHHDVRYKIGTTQIITNHRGYFPYEAISKRFDPSAADFDTEEKANETPPRDDPAGSPCRT
jgi:UDP-2,3-diacylglucosamine pyrophosphatase LpxH